MSHARDSSPVSRAVIDKPGKGSVFATDFEHVLRTRGVQRLVLGGITTDVCVHTTMREANDRGFECLIVADGTGATDAGNHAAALKMVGMQGGVFGAVAPADAVCAAFAALAPPAPPPPPPEAPVAVASTPYPWPCGEPLAAATTALVLIDMQVDFCGPGGYVDSMGYDISLTRAPIEPLRRCLAAARAAGVLARGAVGARMREFKWVGPTISKMLEVSTHLAYPGLRLLDGECEVGVGCQEAFKRLLPGVQAPKDYAPIEGRGAILAGLLAHVRARAAAAEPRLAAALRWTAERARARYRGAVPAASIADELTLVDLQVQLCEWRKFRNHVPGAAGAARGATPDGVADPAAKQPKQPSLKRARKD